MVIKMFYKNKSIIIMALLYFFTINIFIYGFESKFLSVGNVKIVRNEPLEIKREDLKIIINKDKSISIESDYTFKNLSKYNIKSTYMFWMDIEGESKKGDYIKNLKFYSDYKKIEHLRALIKFSENIYKFQKKDNITREWFAISKTIAPKKEGKLSVFYNIINGDFNNEKEFIYNFDLVENFNNKNEIGVLYINIINKSEELIDRIEYKNYKFKKNLEKNENFELILGKENVEGKLKIYFK